jgi:hypothetical protein
MALSDGLGRAALAGAISGLAGVAAMTLAEKLEQTLTGRPSSYVPARTLAHLLGLSRPDADLWARNMLMHWANGLVLGALRGVMAAGNLRGPGASLMHAQVRLTWDQTLENLTGVGAPPWTWPREELVVDVLHKTLFSLATGAVADALIPARPGSSARRPALGARVAGRA